MDKATLLGQLAVEPFKTQSDHLADRIKKMITENRFEDGFVFPNENEFCKILNVSRGTLRDVYKKLETQGFIKRTKQGTYVNCKETIAMQGNFSASLELASHDEMFEFIAVFEPDAVFLAAEKIDDEGLITLEQLVEECEVCCEDHAVLNQANYKLHEFIRNQSQNTLVISALSAYYDIFDKNVIAMIYYLLQQDAGDFRNNALRQHRELLEAFKAHDGERARRIAYEHLQADLKLYRSLKK